MIEQNRMTVEKKVRVGSLEVLDPSTSQLYQKILQPSLCAVSVQTHPNRHGVEIHSSVVTQKKPSCSYVNHIKKQQRLKSDLRTYQSRSFPDINNSRLTTKADCSSYLYQHVHSDVYLQRSTTPQSFSSTTKVKQILLPSVQGTIHERLLSPRHTRSFTLSGERYLGSAKSRPQQRSLSAGRLPRSEQENRFAKEQMELDKSRSMKRMSEMMSHRVDRMYYMRGAVVQPSHRYHVDSDELVRLKEMSKARSSGRRSRNGSSCYGNRTTTPPLTNSQTNVVDKQTDDCVAAEVRTLEPNATSLSNRPRSAASNKSNGSARSGDQEGRQSASLTEAQSGHATFSEISRNGNHQRLIGEGGDTRKEPMGSDVESCEPWAEVAQKVESVENGRVNSSKTISDSLPISIIDQDHKSSSEEIFLTQFENPLVKKDLLDNENAIEDDDTRSCSSNNSVTENMSGKTRKNKSRRSKGKRSNSREGLASDEESLGSGNGDADKISLKDEGYDMNTNDEEIKNMEDGIRKFDIVSNQMASVGRLEGSEIGLDGEETEEETYDSGVFSKPRSEEEIKAALARREKKRKEKADSRKREEDEMRRKAMPKEEKAAILADVYNFISPRQQAVFEEKFEELDVNGNGVLTLDELQERMKKWVAKEDVKLIMRIFDLNKDRTIDIREFVTMAALNDKITGHVTESPDQPLNFSLKRLSHHVTSYKEMFDIMDVNGNGQLSMDELMVIVVASTGLDLQVDQDVVKYIYDTIDRDKSGSIDFVEYLSYIPFFLKLYKHVFGKPISLDAIEDALHTVRQHNW